MINKYVIIVLFTSLLWGGNFVVSKILVSYTDPVTLTTLRWIVAMVVLLPIVLWKEKKFLPHKKSIIPLIIMGITGVIFVNIFQFIALEHTSTTNVGLISTLNTISIAFFAFIFLREKINHYQMGAIMISLIGVIFVISQGDLKFLLTLNFNIGDLWMMGAVLSWGMYSACSKWAMRHTSSLLCTFYSGVIGLALLLPFSASSLSVSAIDASFVFALLYTGIISTIVCMLLWNIGIQNLGASRAGVFLNFNPVFTSILAFIFLGEKLTWMQFVGGLIVICGCYLFSYFQKHKFPILFRRVRVRKV